MNTRTRRVWIFQVIVGLMAAHGFGATISPTPFGEQLETVVSCAYTPVNLNTTISGALTTSDCAFGSGFGDDYLFFAAAGTNINLTLKAPALGSVLLLILDYQTGTALARDNEVNLAIVKFQAPKDAFYLCRVRGVDANHPTGPYTLNMTGVKNPNGCSVITDPTTLCVGSDRFRVQVAWDAVHEGTQGNGTATALTSDTGSFWFFTSSNVELVIKILDARVINGHFWVFYGALTNVQYTITITDTQTGLVKTYTNPQDSQASFSDTSAF